MSEGTTDTGRAEALHAAVAAIYFADSADYGGALWDVVRALSPETADLLERDEEAAFEQTFTALPRDRQNAIDPDAVPPSSPPGGGA